MAPRSIAFRSSILAAILFCLGGAGAASDPVTQPPAVELIYHSLIPLGTESFSVHSWNSVLTVLASAASPHFEGWRRVVVGERRRLLDAEGQPVRYFPGHLEFRITASTMTRVSDAPPYPLRTEISENDYLLQLRFRIKAFHGLHQKVIRPESVALIGEPADIPYDERVYRVAFDLDRIPTEDRLVLEVMSPNGERLCKFHLDLN